METNKRVTAVQWLQLQIDNKDMGEIPLWVYEFIDQALAMEKENSEISFFAGYNYEGALPIDEHEQYYKETFTEK
jgi:hypothetical protein